MINVSRIVFLFTAFLLLTASTICSAEDIYMDNPNYLYLYKESGEENYLDRHSVSVDQHTPPVYRLEGDVLHLPKDEDAKVTKTHVVFKYDYKEQTASYYIDGIWIEVNIFGHSSADKHNIILANTLFYAAYGIDFYH